MEKVFTLVFVCLCCSPLLSQNITGPELLEKSIQYHSPNAEWRYFKAGLHLTETRPNGTDRKTHVHFNNEESFFELIQKRDGHKLVHTFEREGCFHKLNGSSKISDADREKHKLNCERTRLLRDYYLYLWGLPMKLADYGTIVHEEVVPTDFQGNEVLAMKVTYDESVGKDIWYFYFDPTSYALVGYRFYHDESKNDGEYITLEGEEIINGVRFPKTRKWYYNKDDKFLGADILEK